ncbi:type VI secretion system baseplate subunit TssF [Pseudomonas aeruginosa]|nr:type VI secretion system baseplate subunit TssF [Pseudomonas aeruginosa]
MTPATPSYAPPLNRDFLWKLISNMSLNYLSLANVDALKVILETYDLRATTTSMRRRSASACWAGSRRSATSMSTAASGPACAACAAELTIDPEGYIGEGDLFVFASVLNEFFALTPASTPTTSCG